MKAREQISPVTSRPDGATRFNLAGSYDPHEDGDFELESTVDISILDPPLGPDELGFIQHYRVTRILGSGGMGIVFEAEDTHLKRPVALKVMKREFVTNYTNRERFLLEARAAAALDSDHIVTVHQVGMTKDVPFLAMQLLQGEPLDARLEREAPLPMPEAVLIARQVAEGLVAAHGRGLVHRDIKPANIWLETDERTKAFKRVKLLDFGLARMMETSRKLTNAGMIVGTPQFMSPEQASGAVIDCRSDLFSLGTVLFVMLTGRLPFNAPTAPAMLIEIVSREAPRPSRYNSMVPTELDDLVLKLMAKAPEGRPDTAIDVVDTLDLMLCQYSFLMPGRVSSVAGLSGTKLGQTVQTFASTPMMPMNPVQGSGSAEPGTTPLPSREKPFDLANDLGLVSQESNASLGSNRRMLFAPAPPTTSALSVVVYQWIALISLVALGLLILLSNI